MAVMEVIGARDVGAAERFDAVPETHACDVRWRNVLLAEFLLRSFEMLFVSRKVSQELSAFVAAV